MTKMIKVNKQVMKKRMTWMTTRQQ